MNKKRILIAIFLIVTGLLVTRICLPKKMEVNSFGITDKQERIENLSEEIAVFSEILDAEYNLFKSSGFGYTSDLVELGPIDTEYKFAVKVKPPDVVKWKKGLVETKGDINNEYWIKELTHAHRKNWVTSTTPLFYTRPNAITLTIVTYEKEGIIFKSIVQE
jgi:hypothetical protein